MVDDKTYLELVSLGWIPPAESLDAPSRPIFITEFLRLEEDGTTSITRLSLSEWPEWAGSLRARIQRDS